MPPGPFRKYVEMVRHGENEKREATEQVNNQDNIYRDFQRTLVILMSDSHILFTICFL